MELHPFTQTLASIFTQNNLEKYVTPHAISQFYTLTTRMLEVNEHMNLTAITDPAAVILRHYADSLTAADYLPENAHVVDIGCGAGFPTLPLAIVRPDLTILALDSTAKRIRYVAETAEMLGLHNVTAVTSRAEDGAAPDGGAWREAFDVAISRAVANLPVLCELCLPYVRVGGKFIAMKAAQAADELAAARGAIPKLGGGNVTNIPLELLADGEKEERNLILIEKIGQTPKNYPRNYAQIKKKPL